MNLVLKVILLHCFPFSTLLNLLSSFFLLPKWGIYYLPINFHCKSSFSPRLTINMFFFNPSNSSDRIHRLPWGKATAMFGYWKVESWVCLLSITCVKWLYILLSLLQPLGSACVPQTPMIAHQICQSSREMLPFNSIHYPKHRPLGHINPHS